MVIIDKGFLTSYLRPEAHFTVNPTLRVILREGESKHKMDSQWLPVIYVDDVLLACTLLVPQSIFLYSFPEFAFDDYLAIGCRLFFTSLHCIGSYLI